MKIIVLGGGPAGALAALRARELGADVLLLEAKRLGGTGINTGAVPVRTLAKAARLVRDSADWETFGLRGTPPTVNFEAVLANAQRVVNYAHDQKHIEQYMRDHGVELIDQTGSVRFVDAQHVALPDGRQFHADRFIIAVGGQGKKLPIPGNELAYTYNDLWTLKQLPNRVAVVGGAATGCQLASIFRDFGARVDLIEAASRITSQADEDISVALTAGFERRGVNVLTNAMTQRIEATANGLVLHYRQNDGSGSLTTDSVFFAVGWPGNVEPLEFNAAGINVDRGYVSVNEYLQTNVPHIFAVGDVNGLSMLVQSAANEGRLAAENAVLGPHLKFSREVVPISSSTDPEFASVGLTELQARAQHDCAVALVRYDVLTRAVVDARIDGFCKLIVDRGTGCILGAHVVGEHSAEVIQVAATCMAGGLTVNQVADLKFAYPTFAEALGLAARRLIRETNASPTTSDGHVTHELFH